MTIREKRCGHDDAAFHGISSALVSGAGVDLLVDEFLALPVVYSARTDERGGGMVGGADSALTTLAAQRTGCLCSVRERASVSVADWAQCDCLLFFAASHHYVVQPGAAGYACSRGREARS